MCPCKLALSMACDTTHHPTACRGGWSGTPEVYISSQRTPCLGCGVPPRGTGCERALRDETPWHPGERGGGGGACEGHGPYLVHLCVHNTKRPNSTHPITVASPMQNIMPVMNRCLHTCSESSWHVQQKAHTLPPPPHTQPLISMCSTSTQQWTHSLPAALQSRNAASEPY